jgi:predicted phage tail protein
MMALTRAWMPGVWAAAVSAGAVAAEALVVDGSAVAVVGLAVAAAPTVLTLAVPPKILASDTVVVADAAVPPLNF